MPITLHADALAATLERAYVLAISKRKLSPIWTTRAEQLRESPSVGYIAAVGAVLLAKATDPRIDAFVIQAQEGSAGAFNLRSAATALAKQKRALGYDIGSSSNRDPINQGTLVSSTRWDVALDRIREDHKPFFQLILTWLPDVNRLTQDQALEALAAYVRVRRGVGADAVVGGVPASLGNSPELSALVDALDAFVNSNPQGGATGMAVVAAAFRAAGFEVVLPSRNDPRPIDVSIKRSGALIIGSEVKQVDTGEATADALAADVATAGAERALLAVLRPGVLVDFDRAAVIRRAERTHNVVLRVAYGTRELLHEALSSSEVDMSGFIATLPRLFAEALHEIRVSDPTFETWVAIASSWR
ncbi:MAG: restriction endonuclease, SacI family [Solirubrobacteraceae bacterium]